MATFDLRLTLYVTGAALGFLLIVVAFIGELVGWWNDIGPLLGLLGLGVSVILGLLAASRFQVRELGGETRKVASGVERLERSSERIEGTLRRVEASSGRIEANTQRVEANTQRIDANTEAIPGIKADTAETVALLRDIRDRLPAPGR